MKYKFEYTDQVCDYLIAFDADHIDDVMEHVRKFLLAAGFSDQTIEVGLEAALAEYKVSRYLNDHS